MLTKIICERCHEILRHGDIGANIEKKMCITCVTESSPKADLTKIKQLNQFREQPMTKSSSEIELDNFKERLKKLNIELPYKKMEDGWSLVIEIKDYFGNTFAEFGFTKKKLLEFIQDITDIEEKERLK